MREQRTISQYWDYCHLAANRAAALFGAGRPTMLDTLEFVLDQPMNRSCQCCLALPCQSILEIMPESGPLPPAWLAGQAADCCLMNPPTCHAAPG
jgi:hypothetical protein